METSFNLRLPYLMPSQAQKHVTHNEALRILDNCVQISVLEQGLSDLPQGVEEGARYLISPTATGDLTNKENSLACFVDGAWQFLIPAEGWLCWVINQEEMLIFRNQAWHSLGESILDTENGLEVSAIGINAAADTGNKLTVSGNNTLLNHQGQGHQLKINKATASDTASVLFQNNFDGKAEFGLTGDDNWRVKVSADGSHWREVLRADATTGAVAFPGNKVELDPSLVLNLLSDSGRFNGADNQHKINSDNSEMPGYLFGFNGATIAFPWKFVHNNSTFGGNQAALSQHAQELLVKIFGASGLRYGPEFWAMDIASGSGTNSFITIGNEQFYRATIGLTNPRPAKFTTGFFLKCVTGKAALWSPNAQVHKATRDGVGMTHGTNDVVVTPSDGWVYFEMQLIRSAFSYEQNDMAVALANGSQCQFALPRVVNGWVEIGYDGASVLPNARVFG